MEYNFTTEDKADEACRAIARIIPGVVIVECEHRGHVRLIFAGDALLDFEILTDKYYEDYLAVTITK